MSQKKVTKLDFHDRLMSDKERRKEEMMILAVRMWRTVWYVGSTYCVAAGLSVFWDGVGHWEAFLGLGIANLFWLQSEKE